MTSRSGKNVPLKDYVAFLDLTQSLGAQSFAQHTLQLYEPADEPKVAQMATQKYRCFPLLVGIVNALQLKGYWPLQVALTKEVCFDSLWQKFGDYIQHKIEHSVEVDGSFSRFLDALEDMWQAHLQPDLPVLDRTQAKRKPIQGNLMLVEGLLEGDEDKDWELSDIDSQSFSYKPMNDSCLSLKADLSDVDACLSPGYKFDSLRIFFMDGTVHLWSRTGSKVHLLEICMYGLGPSRKNKTF